jgi:hypothetical protein
MGAFLLLMERFEAKLLGVALAGDVDDELLGAVVGPAYLSRLQADRGHRRFGAAPAESTGPPIQTAVVAGTST